MLQQFPAAERSITASIGRSKKLVMDVLQKCNVPVNDHTFRLRMKSIEFSLLQEMQVVKIEGHEADDVVATLVHQVLHKGYRAVIASPDKDFKQLISEDVQMVIPVQELNRWSFYTLKHYITQYNCDPQSDLSLSKHLSLIFCCYKTSFSSKGCMLWLSSCLSVLLVLTTHS